VETPVVQRWREQVGSYRPTGETIRKQEYDVEPLEEADAKAFVLRHHYLQSFPAARRCFGLYRCGELVGVSVFSQGLNHAATVKELPGPANLSVTLGRLVLLDEVPGNAESYFIRWSFWHLDRQGFVGVASFSDPLRIVLADGTVTHRGHIGNIYQATNGCYRGQARAEWKLLLPNGRYLQNDSLTKIRHLKEGWRYSAQLLADFGAPMLDPTKDDPVVWLNTHLPRYTRRVKHPGNHKYLWTLNRRHRGHLPASEPYPKIDPRKNLVT
jgi:hypothetical protein